MVDVKANTPRNITSFHDLTHLRSLVRTHVSRHLYESALFWSAKICTISNNDENDVIWYANVLFINKHYLRAATLLTKNTTITTTPVESSTTTTTPAATNLTHTNLEAR